jgi:hypothetical protein
MPSKYGFESEEENQKKQQEKRLQEQRTVKEIFIRIDPIVKDILSDFISTFKKEMYVSSKDIEWRATVYSADGMPLDKNWIIQGEVATEAKGEDYRELWAWSSIRVRIWISFDEFVTANGVASLGDAPYLYICCNPDEKYGIRLDNILKFCEVLNKETNEVIVLASADYKGSNYIGDEKTWPTHPPTLSIVRPRQST